MRDFTNPHEIIPHEIAFSGNHQTLFETVITQYDSYCEYILVTVNKSI